MKKILFIILLLLSILSFDKAYASERKIYDFNASVYVDLDNGLVYVNEDFKTKDLDMSMHYFRNIKDYTIMVSDLKDLVRLSLEPNKEYHVSYYYNCGVNKCVYSPIQIFHLSEDTSGYIIEVPYNSTKITIYDKNENNLPEYFFSKKMNKDRYEITSDEKSITINSNNEIIDDFEITFERKYEPVEEEKQNTYRGTNNNIAFIFFLPIFTIVILIITLMGFFSNYVNHRKKVEKLNLSDELREWFSKFKRKDDMLFLTLLVILLLIAIFIVPLNQLLSITIMKDDSTTSYIIEFLSDPVNYTITLTISISIICMIFTSLYSENMEYLDSVIKSAKSIKITDYDIKVNTKSNKNGNGKYTITATVEGKEYKGKGKYKNCLDYSCPYLIMYSAYKYEIFFKQ